MAVRQIMALGFLLGLVMPGYAGEDGGAKHPPGKRPIDAAAVARFPRPGRSSPARSRSRPTARRSTYLKSESTSLSRVLWRVEVAGGAPRVIARPPGQGDTDTNVSQAEALRRERQRLRDTGITQVVRAEKADVADHPAPRRPLPAPRRRPARTAHRDRQPRDRPASSSPDGTKVAFVRDDELYVLDLAIEEGDPAHQGRRATG